MQAWSREGVWPSTGMLAAGRQARMDAGRSPTPPKSYSPTFRRCAGKSLRLHSLSGTFAPATVMALELHLLLQCSYIAALSDAVSDGTQA